MSIPLVFTNAHDKHRIMLLTEVITDDGERRVYFTRVNSVVAYFEEDGDGNVIAHAHDGDYVLPYCHSQEKLDAVKLAMLCETARRLHVRPDQVELMTLSDIINVCDPPLKVRDTWTGRQRRSTRITR